MCAQVREPVDQINADMVYRTSEHIAHHALSLSQYNLKSEVKLLTSICSSSDSSNSKASPTSFIDNCNASDAVMSTEAAVRVVRPTTALPRYRMRNQDPSICRSRAFRRSLPLVIPTDVYTHHRENPAYIIHDAPWTGRVDALTIRSVKC